MYLPCSTWDKSSKDYEEMVTEVDAENPIDGSAQLMQQNWLMAHLAIHTIKILIMISCVIVEKSSYTGFCAALFICIIQ